MLQPRSNVLTKLVAVRRYRQGILIISACSVIFIITVFSNTQSITRNSQEVFNTLTELSGFNLPISPPPLEASSKIPQEIVKSTQAETTMTSSQASTTQPPCKKYNLVACVMVHNEMAYLPEWLEFHRLQGVEHFVVYTYFSTDLPEYLPMLYTAAGVTGLIDIIPARFFNQDPKREQTKADYAQNREWSMVDCNVRYRRDTRWLLLTDVGRFVYPTKHRSIMEFLDEIGQEKPVSAVRVAETRFGASGVRKKFGNWITPNVYTGSADLMYEPSPERYPLILESEFEKMSECKPEEDCESDTFLIKGDRCPVANITECIRPTSGFITTDAKVFRANVYNWANESGETLKGSSTDKEILKFVRPLRDAIDKLKPRIFIDVQRKCEKVALDSGQQMKCPSTHPYPFGNQGTVWLRSCCKTDQDWAGAPLTVEANSCYNKAAVDCPEPVGVPKWSLRSCCIGDIATNSTTTS